MTNISVCSVNAVSKHNGGIDGEENNLIGSLLLWTEITRALIICVNIYASMGWKKKSN